LTHWRSWSICFWSAVVMGCSCAAPHRYPAFLRLEAIGGAIVDVPLGAHLALPWNSGAYRNHRQIGIAELHPSAYALMSAPGAYRGCSGAPVLVNGEIVGGLCWGSDEYEQDGPIGYASISDIGLWADIARRSTEDTSRWQRAHGGADECVPGSLIQAATLWGDLDYGPTGVVTRVQDGWVSLFAHSGRQFTGTHYSVLLNARPLAVVSEGTLHRLVFNAGVPVGCEVFESPYGSYGRIGALPPHFRVQ